MTTANKIMKKPISILHSSTVSDVLKKLLEYNISRVIIREDQKAIGIITEKDLGFFLFQEKTRQSLDRIPLDRILKKIVFVNESEPLTNCANILLEKKISSLAIGDEDNVQGIFTKTDLTNFYAQNYPGKKKVEDYMTKNYFSTHFSATLSHVIQKMLENQVSRLITVNQSNQPVGVISLRDFFRLALTLGTEFDDVGAYAFSDKIREGFLSDSGFGSTTMARDIMSKDLITVKSDDDLAEACKILVENKVNGLGVLDKNDNVSGIISKTDVIHALASFN